LGLGWGGVGLEFQATPQPLLLYYRIRYIFLLVPFKI
jgi:hypothetical protein